MKFPVLVLSLFATFTLSLHAATNSVSPVLISVEQRSSTKPVGAKASASVVVVKKGEDPKGEKTQRRGLTIKLANNSSEPVDGLVVKYFFIGHDMADQKIKVVMAGERKSSLAPNGKDTVESEDVAINYTEAHSLAGKGKAPPKKIPAAGQKITGYAVRVMSGSRLMAATASELAYDKIAAEYTPPAVQTPKPTPTPTKAK